VVVVIPELEKRVVAVAAVVLPMSGVVQLLHLHRVLQVEQVRLILVALLLLQVAAVQVLRVEIVRQVHQETAEQVQVRA
jgi:hypothetical protein